MKSMIELPISFQNYLQYFQDFKKNLSKIVELYFNSKDSVKCLILLDLFHSSTHLNLKKQFLQEIRKKISIEQDVIEGILISLEINFEILDLSSEKLSLFFSKFNRISILNPIIFELKKKNSVDLIISFLDNFENITQITKKYLLRTLNSET